ncbi:YdcF family protein [Acinetobacter puyangensis]|uniref:YdcF family protein n=1 Tax=Acinetobacter puyangensis TaxID=1096779 RepID=UPI003A4E5463
MTKIIRIILLFIGSILCLDGLILILQAKINFGTVIPFLLGLIFLIHAFFWTSIQAFLRSRIKLKRLWQILWFAFLIWCASFFYFVWALQQKIDDQALVPPVRALIVLGAGIEKNGQPSPTLAKRLDRAAPIALAQPKALVIVSGGVGFNEKQSEAEVMANYLHVKYHLPLQQIALEDQSTSTELNLIKSKHILAEHDIQLNQPIAIITNDFHIIRSAAIARKQGYQNILMLSSETPLSIRYNAILREYFAFVSGWILNEY